MLPIWKGKQKMKKEILIIMFTIIIILLTLLSAMETESIMQSHKETFHAYCVEQLEKGGN